uniref:(northern house mosquito) hypothetical protein n=1 Tax=Culex pipiens TaxID=7175 RepID=A0A8D8GU63_CULPI
MVLESEQLERHDCVVLHHQFRLADADDRFGPEADRSGVGQPRLDACVVKVGMHRRQGVADYQIADDVTSFIDKVAHLEPGRDTVARGSDSREGRDVRHRSEREHVRRQAEPRRPRLGIAQRIQRLLVGTLIPQHVDRPSRRVDRRPHAGRYERRSDPTGQKDRARCAGDSNDSGSDVQRLKVVVLPSWRLPNVILHVLQVRRHQLPLLRVHHLSRGILVVLQKILKVLIHPSNRINVLRSRFRRLLKLEPKQRHLVQLSLGIQLDRNDRQPARNTAVNPAVHLLYQLVYHFLRFLVVKAQLFHVLEL